MDRQDEKSDTISKITKIEPKTKDLPARKKESAA